MKKQSSLFLLFSRVISFTIRILLRTRYKIQVKGEEVFEKSSPLLLLPNHQALVDPIILVSHVFRFSMITPVISEKYFDIPVAKTLFRKWGAVRVSDLESGNRDTNVLKVITRSVIKGFKRKNNILLYPSGQISAHGYERIFNKKSAYHIVLKLPEDVRIIGVRITGLWGSSWSKAGRTKSPNFFLQVVKGFFYILANLIFFLPKRLVILEFEDLTDGAKNAALEGIKPFNLFLENFYNQNGEEPARLLKHFFYT